MSWNYRLIEKYCPLEKQHYYEVHEAYYDPPDLDKPHSISERAVIVTGASPDEVKTELEHMLVALTKPTLKYTDF